MTLMEKIEQCALIKHCVRAGMTPVNMLKLMNAGKSCKRYLVYTSSMKNASRRRVNTSRKTSASWRRFGQSALHVRCCMYFFNMFCVCQLCKKQLWSANLFLVMIKKNPPLSMILFLFFKRLSQTVWLPLVHTKLNFVVVGWECVHVATFPSKKIGLRRKAYVFMC